MILFYHNNYYHLFTVQISNKLLPKEVTCSKASREPFMFVNSELTTLTIRKRKMGGVNKEVWLSYPCSVLPLLVMPSLLRWDTKRDLNVSSIP